MIREHRIFPPRIGTFAVAAVPLLFTLTALPSCSQQTNSEDGNSQSESVTSGVLVGDTKIESFTDSDDAGSAEAFRYVATGTGTLGSLSVYLDASNQASVVKVGLYTDNGGNPGTLLTSGSISNPAAGTWSTVAVPHVPVTTGTAYWIAVLSPAGQGQLRFRDVASGGGPTQNSAQTTLSALPSAWSPGPSYGNSPMSAYGSIVATPPPPPPPSNAVSFWPATTTPQNPSEPDGSAVELGTKFRSDVAGTVTGVRFYKGASNTGSHTGHLWNSTGTLLASVTFTGETASGWQQANFSAPVTITPNTTYIVSYHTDVGFYAGDNNFFAGHGVDSGPLHALADGVDGHNGVYHYGASAFPADSFQASNYWVDVSFVPTSGGGCTPTTCAAQGKTCGTIPDGCGGTLNCGAPGPRAFVLSGDAGGVLYSVDTATTKFTKIGTLNCPAAAGEDPSSMAIDQTGVAWVSYTDGSLFKVSTTDAHCTATTFRKGQNGFAQFTMAFANGGAGTPETLYLNGIDAQGAGLGLWKLDLTTMAVTRVGDFGGTLQGKAAELTAASDGTLYGLFSTSPAVLATINKTTAAATAVKTLSSVDTVNATDWCFSGVGSDLWLYTANVTSAPNSTSALTRLASPSFTPTVASQGIGFIASAASSYTPTCQ